MKSVAVGNIITLILLGAAPAGYAQQNPDGKLPVTQLAEPLLLLLRDPQVHNQLKLSAAQQRELNAMNDELDGPLWTTRNQSAERSAETVRDLIARSRRRLKSILNARQQRRLEQIQLWTLGMRAFLRGDVIEKLKLSDQQQKQIREKIETTQAAVNKLLKQAQAGEPRGPLEKQYAALRTDEQKEIIGLLRRDQQAVFSELLGERMDVASLGSVKFKAPEIVGDGPWLNSSPLTLRQLRGKVTALHFWTFGCINCIHNYPAYQGWQDSFAKKGLVMVGVHTPEADYERDFDKLKKKAAEAKLAFPIVVDNGRQNWNAWGNSMWPSVYLIDKQGYVRYWWLGELNWQGAAGEKIFRQRIEELLAE